MVKMLKTLTLVCVLMGKQTRRSPSIYKHWLANGRCWLFPSVVHKSFKQKKAARKDEIH